VTAKKPHYRECVDSQDGFDEATRAEYESWLDTVDECDEEDWMDWGDDSRDCWGFFLYI
jgi:hypothetical protein